MKFHQIDDNTEVIITADGTNQLRTHVNLKEREWNLICHRTGRLSWTHAFPVYVIYLFNLKHFNILNQSSSSTLGHHSGALFFFFVVVVVQWKKTTSLRLPWSKSERFLRSGSKDIKRYEQLYTHAAVTTIPSCTLVGVGRRSRETEEAVSNVERTNSPTALPLFFAIKYQLLRKT